MWTARSAPRPRFYTPKPTLAQKLVIALPGAEGQLGPAGARFGLIWTVETRTTPQGRRGMVVQEDWEVV